MLTFQRIASLTQGKVISYQQDTVINNFIFDSRKALNTPDTLFLAVKGKNHDGHRYIGELFASGVRNFLVEQEVAPPLGANMLLVNDTIAALQIIAQSHRQTFTYPVLGITGSNGKTILKEWLSQALSRKFNLVKSPKSYNSQLGVPLSVLQMREENDFGIFEAGISRKGEMKRLNQIIQPTFGIFTNIGSAHDEGFADKNEKAREKWALFTEAKWVVYCKDHVLVDLNKPDKIDAFTWGEHEKADLRILEKAPEPDKTRMKLTWNGNLFHWDVPFHEGASVENAMHMATILLKLGFDEKFIQENLEELRSVPMRLEVKQGVNQTTIIDDTYNNDLAGLQTALEFLNNQSRGHKKILILSDIVQVGFSDGPATELLNLVNGAGLDKLYAVGPELRKIGHRFDPETAFFESTDEFLKKVSENEFSGDFILIKGARPFQFEKISRFLSEKIHGTKLEINLDALSHNLNFYKSLLKPDVKIMVMVKAFAYGSGSTEVASLLQFHKVDYLAVAYADEGIEMRKQGISAPVMVMNTTPESFDKLVEYRLEPEIFSLPQLSGFISFLKKNNVRCGIHLKIDTGMKRLGFEIHELDNVLKIIGESACLKVVSAFTHLAGSDEEQHNKFSLQQLQLFMMAMEKIKSTLGYRPLFHALNSPGIVRFPDYQFDMVRLGIGLYGHESCGIYPEKLRPISTLKTEISQIKKVKKGETIGYGRKGKAETDLTIATIAIGYADGFSRAFSNGKIAVNVHGKMAPVIGNVCMDMSMIDLTGIKAREGDEVIIFGEKPTIQELATAIDTIPYEILTNVSERVKRVYFSE